MRSIHLVLAGGLLASCNFRHFEERPLDAPRAAEDFLLRRLDDPGLVEFARANLEEGASDDASFPPASWSLRDLTLAAFYFRHELDVARAEAEGARAAITSAGARPNPTLAIDPEIAPGDTHPWILGFSLDLPLETAGKRGLRVRAAEARARISDLGLGQAAWNVRESVRQALVELDAARADSERLAEVRALRTEHVETLRALRAAGQLGSTEVLRGEQELARLEGEWAHASTRRELALARLAEALGVPRVALEGLELEDSLEDYSTRPAAWPETDDAAAIRTLGLTNRLDLQAALLTHAAAEAELRLELARQYPDLHFGPGTSWDQGTHKYALGFALELPLFQHNEGPIAEAEARRSADAARFLALQEAVIGAIESARTAYLGALRERAAAAGALELAERQVARVNQALAAGATERLSLLEARLQRAELARALGMRDEEAARALGTLEDQLQRPLDAAEGFSRLAPPFPPSSQP